MFVSLPQQRRALCRSEALWQVDLQESCVRLSASLKRTPFGERPGQHAAIARQSLLAQVFKSTTLNGSL